MIKDVKENSCDVLIKKVSEHIAIRGFEVTKTDNPKNSTSEITDIIKSADKNDLRKILFLLSKTIGEYESLAVEELFDEFALVYSKLKELNFETKYIEQMVKNYSENDYSDAMVNAGKTIESMTRNILSDEKEDDSFGTLIYRLKEYKIINRYEKSILDSIRDCRNDNAHGDEIFKELSREEAKQYILQTFNIMKKILNRV